jgi:ATP-dependent Clp protease ATP-binding subunit ClpC
METGELTVMCECTPEALEVVAKKEPSFVGAFHRVDLLEPAPEEAARIVAAAARRFESSHGVEIDESATAAAIELTSRFEPYRASPGKAVRLLSEVLHRAASREERTPLEREDVIAAFSERTGLPRSILSDEVSLDLTDAEAFLERRVLGQSEAVTAMVDLLAVIKAGLQDTTKPLGGFFFVGPTGVGKTELAKATAEMLFGNRDRMIRFDMGEYGSGDAVAKLIGSGWREGSEGELTRRVREQPFSVVLLDEIEKSHPDVFDTLLSLLGEGHVTDASGRTADFRNSVVIMTSNLGADKSEDQSIGFSPVAPGSADARRQHFVERAERFFRPEFFNRIDRIVVFNPLEKEVIRRIARREIGRLVLREGITRRKLLVEIDEPVVDHCAELGFHPKYGARPLQREIERAISRPLARIVVTKGVKTGDLVRFRLQEGTVVAELSRPAPVEEPDRAKAASPKRAGATLEHALQEVLALVERLESESTDGSFVAVSEEADRLLAATHEPGFWDEPNQARDVLARYYDLNGCTERLKSTTRRAHGLAQLVKYMVADSDRSRLPEVRGALEEIEDAADMLRLEVAGAAAGSTDSVAFLFVHGIGTRTEGWAEQLVKMYEHWANRTGRQVARPQGRLGVRIEGLSTYQLLATERGLHRRIMDHGSSLLARVVVLHDERQVEDLGDTAEVVRQYYEGRRQFVKDPRTGARTTNVSAVLEEGKLDIFLLEASRAAALGRPAS